MLVRVLFGAHSYALGMRYVRACLRRWPDNQALWSAARVLHGMELGRFDETARLLEAAHSVHPEEVILSHRLTLCGYQGDLEGAVACSARLQQRQGRLSEQHRELLAKLIFNLARWMRWTACWSVSVRR